jgi:hypothetical protein
LQPKIAVKLFTTIFHLRASTVGGDFKFRYFISVISNT